MRQTPRAYGRWWIAVVACLVLGAAATAADAPWARQLTEQALRDGVDAKLPPILSVVLGIAASEQSTPVRQIVVRIEHKVRGFDVCVADHSKLVIFTADESTQTTNMYLLTPAGKLKKAIAYAAGEPARELTAAESRADFARETRYWSDRAHP